MAVTWCFELTCVSHRVACRKIWLCVEKKNNLMQLREAYCEAWWGYLRVRKTLGKDFHDDLLLFCCSSRCCYIRTSSMPETKHWFTSAVLCSIILFCFVLAYWHRCEITLIYNNISSRQRVRSYSQGDDFFVLFWPWNSGFRPWSEATDDPVMFGGMVA